MKTVFLSDAHLKGPGYAGHEKLMHFFDRLRGRGGTGSGGISAGTLTLDHLVIAGDFFDFWFGRGDAIYPGFRPIVDRMVALKQEGVRISLCEGNHDFFLTDYFSINLGSTFIRIGPNSILTVSGFSFPTGIPWTGATGNIWLCGDFFGAPLRAVCSGCFPSSCCGDWPVSGRR